METLVLVAPCSRLPLKGFYLKSDFSNGRRPKNNIIADDIDDGDDGDCDDSDDEDSDGGRNHGGGDDDGDDDNVDGGADDGDDGVGNDLWW